MGEDDTRLGGRGYVDDANHRKANREVWESCGWMGEERYFDTVFVGSYTVW